jgi:cation:H+ antiporter
MMYAEIIAGFVILLLGGDFLVRGAVSMAERLGVSPLIIGLTIVALGTSAPEFMVSIKAVINNASGIAIGNVVGSNIANVLLVLGLPAMIYPITSSGASLNRDNLIMVGASLLFIAFCWSGTLVAWQGAVFLLMLAAFLYHAYRAAKREGGSGAEFSEDFDGGGRFPNSVAVSLGLIAAGFAGLFLGSHLLVEGSVAVAREAGVSEAVIGLTMVALGTSLPELTTSFIAAVRRHGDVAIGNVVGSNLFNILGVMGAAALMMPVPVPKEILNYDLWIMLAASLLLMPFAFRRWPIGRLAGLVFMAGYLGYITSQFGDHGVKMAELMK